MKNFAILLFALWGFSLPLLGQDDPAKGKFSFFSSGLNTKKSVTVQGQYLGARKQSGMQYYYYHEKVSALKHQVRVVKTDANSYTGKVEFSSMNVYLIDEAALSINDLKVQNNTGEGKDKLPVFVTLRNLQNKSEKDRIQHKTYSAAAGAFNKTEYGVELLAGNEKVDVYFPTKAQAEAFIADLKTLFK